ncbi:MAG: hypothetical protein Q8N69_01410, partial [bacterium]|nr:hypothetical protein [bacterium]
IPKEQDHPLTIMFSIGGAGAQIEIVENYIRALKKRVERGEVRLILSAGIRKEAKDCFLRIISKIGLRAEIDKNIQIILEKDIWSYFSKFNDALRKTDLLWTKPSELSFYSALGVPLILAPSIGSQEDYNRKWLLGVGSGIPQENPKYAGQWIFDYINSGRFAKAALRGFMEIKNTGVHSIKKIIFD